MGSAILSTLELLLKFAGTITAAFHFWQGTCGYASARKSAVGIVQSMEGRSGHGNSREAPLLGQVPAPRLAVNLLAVHVLAVNRPLSPCIVSKSIFCTLYSVKKCVARSIQRLIHARRALLG